MKKTLKKGFTIVELVIVIAVVAILAAVLIPTFVSVTKKANESKDTQLVRNLNTALAVDTEVGKHTTMQSALEAAEKAGYDVAKINTSATDNEILWDSVNDCFVYKKGDSIEYIPNSVTEAQKSSVKPYQYWVISGEPSEEYSTYLYNSTTDTFTVKTGLDVGNETVTSVNYVGNTASQTVTIRTNGGALTVNAPLDNIEHYGTASVLRLDDAHTASYYEYGSVNLAVLTKGRIVIESSANVDKLHVNTADTTGKYAYANAIIALKDGAEMPTVTTGALTYDNNVATIAMLQNVNNDESATAKKTSYIKVQKDGDTLNPIITETNAASDTTNIATDEQKNAIESSLNKITSESDLNNEITILTCDHEYEYISVDDNTHKQVCSKCGKENAVEAHTIVDGKCEKCDFERKYWQHIQNAMTEAPAGYVVSENGNVTISSVEGFAWFAKQVNDTKNTFSEKAVTLMTDIDLKNYYWTPINGFTGTFDGGNKTISNLYVDGGQTGEGFGLFGSSKAKELKNVCINNVYVVGNSALGALVGNAMTAKVDNVHISGDIYIGVSTKNGSIANYNSSYAGGVVGHGYATITNCSVKGNDGSTIGHGRQVGGIYGFSGEGNFYPVSNCSVENVTLTGTRCIGGILGWAHYGNGVKNCTVKNVVIKQTGNEQNTIGLISGTTYSENKNNAGMVFENNSVENCKMYIGTTEITDRAEPESYYAGYGYGECYATNGNGKYVYFDTLKKAIAYAEKNDTKNIVLLKNCTEEVTLPENVTITENGYTWVKAN